MRDDHVQRVWAWPVAALTACLALSALAAGGVFSGINGVRCTRRAGNRTENVLPLPGLLAISSSA